MRLLLVSFKKSLKLAPLVLKDITLYFGLYFFAVSFLILVILTFALPFDLSSDFFKHKTIVKFLVFLSSLFTVFIIPYYCYKYTHGDSPPFWDFISNTVIPLLFAHIKATFVILFYSLLLIVPGIYKFIRLFFVTESVFFDKEENKSFLKKADKTSQSYFWIISVFVFLFFISGSSEYFFSLVLKISGPLSSGVYLLFGFYLSCFMFLWKTMLYFEIKKAKQESISL